MRCVGGARFAVHLELFARREVVIVPPADRRRPERLQLSAAHDRRRPASSTSPARAAGRSAICSASGGGGSAASALLSFKGRVSVFVDGRRRAGDPRSLVLTRHAEIVLEVGGYVTPHPSYLFPKGA